MTSLGDHLHDIPPTEPVSGFASASIASAEPSPEEQAQYLLDSFEDAQAAARADTLLKRMTVAHRVALPAGLTPDLMSWRLLEAAQQRSLPPTPAAIARVRYEAWQRSLLSFGKVASGDDRVDALQQYYAEALDAEREGTLQEQWKRALEARDAAFARPPGVVHHPLVWIAADMEEELLEIRAENLRHPPLTPEQRDYARQQSLAAGAASHRRHELLDVIDRTRRALRREREAQARRLQAAQRLREARVRLIVLLRARVATARDRQRRSPQRTAVGTARPARRKKRHRHRRSSSDTDEPDVAGGHAPPAGVGAP